MKIPVEKMPVDPRDGTAGQARPGGKDTQNGRAAPLFHSATGKVATDKAAAGQTAAGASRNAGSPAVPVPEAPRPGRAVPGGTGAAAPEPAAADRLGSLLSALKLPNDSLSESIVSFSRYFSLQLERASLLRGEVLVQKKREAAALGAAAAADKGLGLESRALEAYADAIDPAEWREPEQQESGQQEPEPEQQEPGQREPGQQEPGRGQQEPGQQGPEQREPGQREPGQQEPGRGQQEPRQREPERGEQCVPSEAGNRRGANGEPTAEELKRQVTAVLGKVPDFINRVPGKNGRRWLVVPFSSSGDGFDLRASFRILLPEPDGKGSGRFAADIAVFREKELSRRWFFLLEGISGGDFRAKRAEFSVFPPTPDTKALVSELAKMFTLPADKITLNKKGNFSDSRDDLLLTVDEEV